ncbi:hypothetical protein C2857_005854 [Epichloe festucae Fl1]|uniref:RRM domain-containing protein n=1 Tax=Epichloe festucae (strain Fl1) TaxID=877507 RepID=A0A7S9PW58_EPIFF|nr:hypothetical protein C2857_005854 [Epichloe festucae Fl1]
MDRGLDEIIADKRSNGRPNRSGGRDTRRRDRNDYPRDGVRKSTRDESRNLDSEWVHDRYDESDSRRAPAPRRRRQSPSSETGSKIRIDNIHYDLTEADLDELFSRIGTVTKLNLRYDRAGRSEGTAYVTYERKEDAEDAIRQFDGANANGQPIRLTFLPSRNPFDTAIMPGRPLSERISNPDSRAPRSTSPRRRGGDDDVARKGIDRYVPGEQSRSPMPRRRGGRGEGRRPGARREENAQESGRGGRGGARSNPRAKKTQEELDAEMADYFGGGSNDAPPAAEAPVNGAVPAADAPAAGNDDIDMIE